MRTDRLALSDPVHAEIVSVLHRPKLQRYIDPVARDEILAILSALASWFDPAVPVADCRDALDNKYLELALAADAPIVVSSDNDLLTLDPWRNRRILRPADYLRFA